MRQLRLTVEYDGTDFAGWQRQANADTVQGHLEQALERLLGHPTRVSGASRTDAGVHARGQVAAFSTERSIPTEGMRRALNTTLPPAIAVSELTEVDPSFHPRFAATGKHYRYQWWLRRDRAPRWRHRAWHHPRPLDIEAMRAGAQHLLGEHDFSAFRAVGCASKSTRRRLDSVTFTEPEPHLLALDVRGNAFLRNMMRIIAGTLTEIGEGRRPADDVAALLAGGDRRRSGPTAPAHGLELMEVFYDGVRGEVAAARAVAEKVPPRASAARAPRDDLDAGADELDDEADD